MPLLNTFKKIDLSKQIYKYELLQQLQNHTINNDHEGIKIVESKLVKYRYLKFKFLYICVRKNKVVGRNYTCK